MVEVGVDHGHREPPEAAQRQLQEYFPECSYEWMRTAKMWRVVRVVPPEQIHRMVREGKLTEEDVDAHRFYRKEVDKLPDTEDFRIHAFTLRDPDTGDPLEPGGWVIEALQAADTQGKKPRKVAMEMIRRVKAREERLWREQSEGIQDMVEDFDKVMEVPKSINPVTIEDGRVQKEEG